MKSEDIKELLDILLIGLACPILLPLILDIKKEKGAINEK